MRVRQGDGLFGFSVKPEESEKVLSCQFVEHEYLTGGTAGKLRVLSTERVDDAGSIVDP